MYGFGCLEDERGLGERCCLILCGLRGAWSLTAIQHPRLRLPPQLFHLHLESVESVHMSAVAEPQTVVTGLSQSHQSLAHVFTLALVASRIS